MKDVRILWLIFAACSSTAAPPTRPVGSSGDGSAGTGELASTGPTERECEQMVAHVIALGAAEHAGRPPDQLPTDADQEHLRTKLRPFIDECRARSRDS